jgi:hypothetical protein
MTVYTIFFTPSIIGNVNLLFLEFLRRLSLPFNWLPAHKVDGHNVNHTRLFKLHDNR